VAWTGWVAAGRTGLLPAATLVRRTSTGGTVATRAGQASMPGASFAGPVTNPSRDRDWRIVADAEVDGLLLLAWHSRDVEVAEVLLADLPVRERPL
jgi:hypothetical protein